jgi:hypothetical protein
VVDGSCIDFEEDADTTWSDVARRKLLPQVLVPVVLVFLGKLGDDKLLSDDCLCVPYSQNEVMLYRQYERKQQGTAHNHNNHIDI